MPINKESLNRKLYKALGRYEPKPVNDQNEVIPLEDEADAFKFNFIKDGENHGVVYATLDDTNTLTIWYSDDVMNSPDAKTPGLEYDDTWSGFLRFIKRWAMNNQLSFRLENKDHLGNEMARRKRMNEKEKISEGYYALGKKASYSDAVPNVKIVLQHSRVMQEGEQRFRHIEKIFVENANGERFLIPTNKPGLARVFARHIAEGGTPYDERAKHIQSLVEEYNKMAGFVRATRNGQFNESAQQLVQEGINHYVSLRESLGKLTGHRGYTSYFENWTPSLMEDETDTNAINELFVQETLDPRIESVMPILSRLHKQVSEMREVDELSEWADQLISEKMVMGADTDAGASGTVFNEESLDDLDEATDLPTIPEEDLDEEKQGLWANIHAKRKRIKAGSGERMRKPGSKGAPSAQDFKDAAKTSNEGLGDVAKKVGGAIKKAAGKAMDVIAPGDEELLKQLQKSAGIRGMNHGKPSMAISDVQKVDEQGVAEAEKKPHPQTWHDVDKKLGKQVDKMSQAEKVKKGLAHPDTLKKKGVAEGFLGDREYNRVMPFVKRIAGEVSDYDRDEFGEELWSLLDQRYGSKFAQSVLADLDIYWDTYTELTGQGLDEASVYKKDQDLSGVSTQELEAFVRKNWGGGIPTYGQGESVKRAMRELRRRQKQGVAEGSFHNPGDQDSPVAQAIIRRILLQRTDLLAKYGPEYVGQAVDDVADFVGDVDEIGSSDVSGWVKQVEQNLKNKLNQYDEPMRDIDNLEESVDPLDEIKRLMGK